MQSVLLKNLERYNKRVNISEYLENLKKYFSGNFEEEKFKDIEDVISYAYLKAMFNTNETNEYIKKYFKNFDMSKATSSKAFNENFLEEKAKELKNDKKFRYNMFLNHEIMLTFLPWFTYKQIYKFDLDALKMISESKTDNLSYEEFKALKMPFECFAIENKISHNDIEFNSFIIKRDFLKTKDEKDALSLTVVGFDNSNSNQLMKTTIEEGNNILDNCPEEILPVLQIILKLIMYFSQPKIDIIKKEVKKQKPKNDAVPKHFYNIDYQSDDIGCELGSTIRNYKYIYEHKEEFKDSNNKRTIRPHNRRGHWHKYWVGKGRKELVTKLLAPITVLGGSKNATIHKVK